MTVPPLPDEDMSEWLSRKTRTPMLRDFPPIQLSPPPGEPTQEEIARMTAIFRARHLEQKRAFDTHGMGGVGGIRECRYVGPKRKGLG